MKNVKGDCGGWAIFMIAPIAFTISIPVDFPLACTALGIGVTASIPIKTVEYTCLSFDKIIDILTNRSPHSSRSVHLDYIYQQSLQLLSLINKVECDESEIIDNIESIIRDMTLLAKTYSNCTLTLGKGYSEHITELPGLRHSITGRSKLADLINQHIISDPSLAPLAIDTETQTKKSNDNLQISPDVTAGLHARGHFAGNQNKSSSPTELKVSPLL